MEQIIGLVITYFPESDIKSRIDTFLQSISEIIIIDNTPETSNVICNLTEKWDSDKKITVKFNNQNYGIAKALNQGAEIAISKGYNWILTMDQDSKFLDPSFFEKFATIEKDNLAIFAPDNNASNKSKELNTEFTSKQMIMTSGNILSLKCWKTIGGFKESLFIDEVDHDFCLRLKMESYRILQYNEAILSHNLGNLLNISILGFKKQLFLHSHERTYYIVRNNLYMFKKYSGVFPKLMRQRKLTLLKDILKIILFSPDKKKHLKYAIDGVLDFKKNNFGAKEKNTMLK